MLHKQEILSYYVSENIKNKIALEHLLVIYFLHFILFFKADFILYLYLKTIKFNTIITTGAVWSKNPLVSPHWQLEVAVRITGRGRIGADGMVIFI